MLIFVLENILPQDKIALDSAYLKTLRAKTRQAQTVVPYRTKFFYIVGK